MNEAQKYIEKTDASIAEFERSLEPEALREAYLTLEQLLDDDGEALRGELRRSALYRWLDLLRLLDNSIDDKFDPADVPSLTVDPPPSRDGVVHRPGVDPARIKDLEARSRYIDAIAANERKARHYSRQIDLRRLEERITPRVEAFVRRAYTNLPADREELRTAIEEKLTRAERAKKLLRLVE